MTGLLRTLAVVACLCLVVQSVRHAYLLWLEPRDSVLDKFDRPLKDEIAAAKSLDELASRYEPIRRDVDRIRAEQRQAKLELSFAEERTREPFRSEASLREAIQSWESRAKEIHGLRFYWVVGLVLAVVGTLGYLRLNRWLGVSLLIAGFSEIIYWTSPTFIGAGTQEVDRLLINKLVLSVLSLGVLALAIRLVGAFDEPRTQG